MLHDSILMLDGASIENGAVVGGTSFPGTTNVGELFFRTDEDKLYIRNAADDGWLDLTGGGGGSSTDVTNRKLEDSTGESYVDEYVFRVINQYSTWTTLKTISFTGVNGSTFTSGMAVVHICGLTNGVGTGTMVAHWYWNISAGGYSAAQMSLDESSASAPEFRIVHDGGSAFNMQVRGNAGAGTITGTVHLELHVPLPNFAGTITVS